MYTIIKIIWCSLFLAFGAHQVIARRHHGLKRFGYSPYQGYEAPEEEYYEEPIGPVPFYATPPSPVPVYPTPPASTYKPLVPVGHLPVLLSTLAALAYMWYFTSTPSTLNLSVRKKREDVQDFHEKFVKFVKKS